MTPRPIIKLSAEAQKLSVQVEHSLSRCKTKLKFPIPLEQQFIEHTHQSNRRAIITTAIFAILLYCSFLLIDFIYRPELIIMIAPIRTCVVLSAIMTISFTILRKQDSRLPPIFSMLCILAASISSGLLLDMPGNPIVRYEPYAFLLIVIAGNVAMPIRFPLALSITILNLTIACFFILPNPNLVSDEKASPLIFLLATCLLTLFANFRLESAQRRAFLFYLREKLYADYLYDEYKSLNIISQTDPLTGIPNRRQFDDILERSWENALLNKSEIGLLMIDIDNFKAFNDTYGHPAGDECLKQVATAINRCKRANGDLAARFGGEEFSVIVPRGGLDAAVALAQRIHERLEKMAITNATSKEKRVTVSIGVATGTSSAGILNHHDLLESADKALYKAKKSGRNRTYVERRTYSENTVMLAN